MFKVCRIKSALQYMQNLQQQKLRNHSKTLSKRSYTFEDTSLDLGMTNLHVSTIEMTRLRTFTKLDVEHEETRLPSIGLRQRSV